MVTIQGSYNTAVCYTPELEEAARKQKELDDELAARKAKKAAKKNKK